MAKDEDAKAPAGQAAAGDGRFWRAAISGLCASLLGIGLARFAYSPLIPALIAEGWFQPSAAAYLGAANLAGYLLGALGARPLAARLGAVFALRGGMVLATVAFFACAWPFPFVWFFVWRFAAGLAGAAIIVLAAPTVLPYVPASRRGVVTGAIFTGVGLGIAASGTLVPPLLILGLTWTWIGLGVVALILTVVAWTGWPSPRGGTGPVRAESNAPLPPAVKAVCLEYGLAAVGLVVHMVFLVDYVARELGQGIAQGGAYWVLFGLGAMCGPMLGGWAGDRIGFRLALRIGTVVQVVAVALPVIWAGPVALGISSVVVGAFVPGIAPLMLGRVQDLLPGDAKAQGRGWSLATIAFSLGQAAGAYGFAAVFAETGTYVPLFWIGTGAIAAAVAVDFWVARLAARR